MYLYIFYVCVAEKITNAKKYHWILACIFKHPFQKFDCIVHQTESEIPRAKFNEWDMNHNIQCVPGVLYCGIRLARPLMTMKCHHWCIFIHLIFLVDKWMIFKGKKMYLQRVSLVELSILLLFLCTNCTTCSVYFSVHHELWLLCVIS